MRKNETTSKSVAGKAAKLLRDKTASADAKSIAASALTQVGGEPVTVAEAVRVLAKALREDEVFFLAYQSSIANAFIDEMQTRSLEERTTEQIANNAAKNFLDQWISQAGIE